jgi:hypothetical protein
MALDVTTRRTNVEQSRYPAELEAFSESSQKLKIRRLLFYVHAEKAGKRQVCSDKAISESKIYKPAFHHRKYPIPCS